jgi:hypothetical protein
MYLSESLHQNLTQLVDNCNILNMDIEMEKISGVESSTRESGNEQVKVSGKASEIDKDASGSSYQDFYGWDNMNVDARKALMMR